MIRLQGNAKFWGGEWDLYTQPKNMASQIDYTDTNNDNDDDDDDDDYDDDNNTSSSVLLESELESLPLSPFKKKWRQFQGIFAFNKR